MRNYFVLLFVFVLTNSFSQNKSDSLKAWKKGGVGTLNFSQNTFSNWAQGGENSLSATAIFNLFANYSKGKFSWENVLDATYGFLQTNGNKMRKSDDKLEFRSKYGYKTSYHWYLTTLVNFKSQFTKGYNYPNDSVSISNFLAPAYLMIATGMDYKPNDHFSFFLSPATGRITIVNDQRFADAGAYGVEKAVYDTSGALVKHGKKVRYEFGALLSARFNKEIVKNITLNTKLDLFSNYFKDPQDVVVNWDVLISMKVNKLVSASISTTLVYDDKTPIAIFRSVNGVKTQIGTGPRTQFKEVLAIGLSYKF
ncbi:MAG TPA: DUF3078 domain-containing protein [Bacteroidia bacterium]